MIEAAALELVGAALLEVVGAEVSIGQPIGEPRAAMQRGGR